MKKKKKWLPNLLLVFISVAITFCLCEYVYRRAIFGDNPSFQKYRLPSYYAADWDENYWKLVHTWKFLPDVKTYPLVGWILNYWPTTFFSPEVKYIEKRRAVLLYGDSFAQCKDSVAHFQNILNNDSAFNKKYYFINYGTGAFGVDQIYTLSKYTYPHFENPIVIFSFMTKDIDRSCLSLREGQKPYYVINENGKLELKSKEIYSNYNVYLKKYPSTIHSYLWRRFLYSDLNFLPKSITKSLTGETANEKQIIILNTKIITQAIQELRESKTDFMFFIFNPPDDFLMDEKDNWRVQFIRKLLDENKVKYVWAKDLIADKVTSDSLSLNPFLIEDDGHPTSLYNRIISEEMKKWVLVNKFESNNTPQFPRPKASYYYKDMLDSVIQKIKSDSTQMSNVRQEAITKNKSIDEAEIDLAMWFLWSKNEKQ